MESFRKEGHCPRRESSSFGEQYSPPFLETGGINRFEKDDFIKPWTGVYFREGKKCAIKR
jgi:hypothetical protein